MVVSILRIHAHADINIGLTLQQHLLVLHMLSNS